ncbi:MAG: thiamine-phosphate kinase [Chloroflexota bacterium]|nr:thiamine-phosphate kinase [Chloroflexota bacterium]
MVQVAGGSNPVSSVGEFKLIDGISKLLASSRVRSSGLALGVGDDTAIWQPRPGRAVTITTDTLVESVHFRRDWSDAQQIGHRALAVNLSDLAAMGSRPRTAVISLGLRGSEQDRWVYDVYRGMLALAQRWHVRIAGGDIVHSPKALTIGVTAHGELRSPEHALRRDRAHAGDIIAVTGPLGLAAAGVRLLSEGRSGIDGAPAMLTAHRLPQPRVLHGMLLARAGVHCAMDLSDGLFGDLPKILHASAVSARVEMDKLPIPSSVRWSFPDWFELGTRGGEDFELLFTAPPEAFERVTMLFRRCRLRPPIAIGTITAPGKDGPALTLRDTALRRRVIEPGAFDHFVAKPKSQANGRTGG